MNLLMFLPPPAAVWLLLGALWLAVFAFVLRLTRDRGPRDARRPLRARLRHRYRNLVIRARVRRRGRRALIAMAAAWGEDERAAMVRLLEGSDE